MSRKLLVQLLVIMLVLIVILSFYFWNISFKDELQDKDELVALELVDWKYVPSRSKLIPINELPQVKLDALSGDNEAALKVAYHHSSRINEETNNWFEIGSENGILEVQYAYVDRLLNYSNDDIESEIRGIFWLNNLVKNGYKYRNSIVSLDDYSYTLAVAQPPDDNWFINDHSELSTEELTTYELGALKGSKKAALVLGRYYEEIAINNDLSEYWYRIGAQNGSPECQYSLGQILSRKDDPEDQVRGNFWLTRAIENGYVVGVAESAH